MILQGNCPSAGRRRLSPKTLQVTLWTHVALPVPNVVTILLLPFAALRCPMLTVLSGYVHVIVGHIPRSGCPMRGIHLLLK